MKRYLIYSHTSPSGKIYIGQTCKKYVNDRWRNGLGYMACPLFWNAIQKYGWDNFEHKIIYTDLTKEQANTLEIELIAKYKALGISYNYHKGGNEQRGKIVREETRRKMSESQRGHKVSEETRTKISESHKGLVIRPAGFHHSEETKKKISEANKGKKRSKEFSEAISKRQLGRECSEETRKKISDSLTGNPKLVGRKVSEETRRRMSEAHKGEIKKPVSEETRRRMSEAAKKRNKVSEETRRRMSEAHKNTPAHTRGKIWITNGLISKMVYPNEIESYIGWRKGRTLNHK